MTSADAAARSRILHAVRLAGLVDVDALVARSSGPPDVVAAVMKDAVNNGLARRLDGRASGWMLTAAGRAEDDRLLQVELEATGSRPDVTAAYQRFLEVNGELLAVCTAWQVRDSAGQQPNEHDDPAYDAAVVERLAALDVTGQAVCGELATALARFGPYGPRLANALARVQAGEVDWFTSPRLDSYHTVWFELHEDQLATLGIERATEATT